MQLAKPKPTHTTYITFTDKETRKSVSMTVYGVSHEACRDRFSNFIEDGEREQAPAPDRPVAAAPAA